MRALRQSIVTKRWFNYREGEETRRTCNITDGDGMKSATTTAITAVKRTSADVTNNATTKMTSANATLPLPYIK
jgi:hypothetical protein